MILEAATTAALFPELMRDETLHLETPRLWLRWPTARDARGLAALAAADLLAGRAAAWPTPGAGDRSGADCVAGARALNTSGDGLMLVLAAKSHPAHPLGMVGVTPERKRTDRLVLWSLLGVEHRGYGLMSEAVGTLADAVFRYTTARAIRGARVTSTLASRRMMEKTGFVPLDPDRPHSPALDEPFSCGELELTRARWRGLRAEPARGPASRVSRADAAFVCPA